MPISRTVKEHIGKASWIRKMFEEGRALKARVGARNVYDFSLGNPVLDPPDEFYDALEHAAADRSPGLHQYMENVGLLEARQAVADWHALESGLEYTSDLILMTVGAAGAINVALKTVVNAGEEVVLLAPYFAEYWFYVDNHGGIPRIVPTDSTFDIDLDALESAISPKTRAIILNSPNNPTGRVYGHSSIDGLASLLEAKQRELGTTIYVVTDEPYRAIVYEDIDVPVVATYYDNTILCTSHSKDLGLPGERIGHIAVGPDAADAKELIDGMAFTIRTLGFVNAPALMQRVVAGIMGTSVDIDFYRRNRDTMYHELTSFGFDMTKPEGAFYLFPRCPIEDDVAFVRQLQKHHILTVPGSGFGTPGYFRISYAVERDVVERSLPVWQKAARELGLKPRKVPVR
ncbi:MAG: pyridoxal phosphate-dependent aminotransferase [Candidatus Krumholzibacteriia bacterium]